MKNIKGFGDFVVNESTVDPRVNAELMQYALWKDLDRVAERVNLGADTGFTAKVKIGSMSRRLDQGLIDVGSQGWTALHCAAWGHGKDQIQIVRLLMHRGWEVDAQTDNGGTPLRLAVLQGNSEVAKEFIEAGADPFKGFKDAQEAVDLFKGDIDWWPEGPMKTKLQRMKRGKQAFGM